MTGSDLVVTCCLWRAPCLQEDNERLQQLVSALESRLQQLAGGS
jgi:hypothetical protein